MPVAEPSAPPIRRALLSVSDKRGLVPLGLALQQAGVEILSTGGTAQALRAAGVNVMEVSAYTGAPEIMGGRVKTLHPRIHGGLLGRRGEDEAVMRERDIPPIDLLVVNLYPFSETIAQPGCTPAAAIEQIDIGGPAMLRAAAKNHERVTAIVDATDYETLIADLGRGEGPSAAWRRQLAAKAFGHTAAYDAAVATYLLQIDAEPPEAAEAALPAELAPRWLRVQALRYGENPHQQAALYRQAGMAADGTLANARQLQGKALSYNNLADADAALACVLELEAPACVIVKHANPCGVAVAGSLSAAYEAAFATDPTSAFGGILAFNRPLPGELAELIVGRQFAEVILAPEITPAAAEIFAGKPNLRVLALGRPAGAAPLQWHAISGGMLVQTADTAQLAPGAMRVVTRRAPSTAEQADLAFAWRVAKYVKSNAIVYACDQRTIGIGAGQMSRVYSARIAAIKAADEGLQVAGAVMASDAFFPFRDGIDSAAEAGIRAVIQPGGSVRDAEVIAAADAHDIAMVFTGIRHFRH